MNEPEPFLITAARWARRHWPMLWPNLAMAAALMVGLVLGLVTAYAFRPTTELAASLIAIAGVVTVQALTFTVLVVLGRAVAPPAIAVWVVAAIFGATLLVIF
ncbi:MAG: hypothetical protein ACRDRU_20245 [Pseudonocardiaceae bacterium]